jgi:hypothetical protein
MHGLRSGHPKIVRGVKVAAEGREEQTRSMAKK